MSASADLPHPAIETQQILRKQLNAARALNDELMVEQDRLKEANAELVAALDALVCEASCDIEADDGERDAFNAAVDAAMAVLAKAKGAAP
jgi:hypothetical protein